MMPWEDWIRWTKKFSKHKHRWETSVLQDQTVNQGYDMSRNNSTLENQAIKLKLHNHLTRNGQKISVQQMLG